MPDNVIWITVGHYRETQSFAIGHISDADRTGRIVGVCLWLSYGRDPFILELPSDVAGTRTLAPRSGSKTGIKCARAVPYRTAPHRTQRWTASCTQKCEETEAS